MRPLARAWPVVGLVTGLGVGVATSYLQGVLPGSWNTLANSGAVWTVVAFAVAMVVTDESFVPSVLCGLLTLLGEVLGYYAIAAPLRHVATSAAERTLWVVAAVVIGPLAGWAAWLVRRGRAAERLCAAVGVCGVVVGEGLHAVLRISRSSAAGWTEIVLGATVALALVAGLPTPVRGRLAAAGVGVVVALAVFAVYGETVLG